MVLRMMLDNVRLPGIIAEFLERTAALHKLVANATHEILVEVKTMLYEQESKSIFKILGNRLVLIVPSFTVAWG